MTLIKIDSKLEQEHIYFQGRQTGGRGWGVSTPLNFRWGVEHLSTPPDFEKIFLGGVGSP